MGAEARERRREGKFGDVSENLPLTPPESDNGESQQSSREASQFRSAYDYPIPPISSPPKEVLEQDKKTPDGWLARDPRLIRLTGVHPFNVEPNLSDLFNEGFLTSPELFYVRNHGAVPRVEDHDVPDWEFSVEGMVEQPFSLTLRELMAQYDQKTSPITMVCAGNRRKEQNVVRKTKGFSWGAAGVSTALWTGVSMGDVIRRAKPRRGARYVCMEGADELPNGCYGTSVKLNWALDQNRGMMLAHSMNGEMLRPDHGKPLRVVIPGQIGGRSVKWLKRLIITAEPSDNWYHIYDNRVLPTSVSPEESANNRKWWEDERYAIYDLSPNSAVAFPAHDERISLDPPSSQPDDYKVRGYAYSGGGKRITRVEVTLDKGKTWRLANIEYFEDQYRDAGTHELCGGTLDMEDQEASFTWSFWNIYIAMSELAEANDILVRCMDEGMSVQPRDLYWNVMGMMNNPWFRVTVHKEDSHLRFEHPTQPALLPGGWMEKVKKAGGDLVNGYWGGQVGIDDEARETAPVEAIAEVKMTNDTIDKVISLEELRQHDGEDTPWFVVNGNVYDGRTFLKEHPGGAQSIISAAATDCTEEFIAIHSETAKAMMKDFHIGTLDEDSKASLNGNEADDSSHGDPPRELFLNSKSWRKAILKVKKSVSSDTRVLTFSLDHNTQPLGLPTGQHLMVRLRDPATREAIIRAYTPISSESKQGTMDVLVKIYEQGKMTQALDGIPVGHPVDFKGPIGKFRYLGRGACSVNDCERKVKSFVMICGGSGITPILQIFRAVMSDPEDSTKCVVLNGNRAENDILCREELDKYANEGTHGKACLIHTLTRAPDGWEGRKGRIAEPLLQEFADCTMHPDAIALICGPEAMEKSVKTSLLNIGWREQDLLFF